jgi:hypothetical protein
VLLDATRTSKFSFRNGTKRFLFVPNYATRRDVLFVIPHQSLELPKKADCTDEFGFLYIH